MLTLPLGLIVLCHGWLSGYAQAKQCRLVLPNEVFSNHPQPSSTSTSVSPTTTISTTPTPSTSQRPSSTPTPKPFNYGVDKIRAVNLGGWFVLEPWITPSIFEYTGNEAIVDEYTLGQLMDGDAARKMLRHHWETWITEEDFVAMAAAGLNHVRIPVGYWSVPLTSADSSESTDPSPYIPGAWPYLLKALNWAKANQLHVIFDLHGAPGSQNGYDNSGQRTGDPQWAKVPSNLKRTLDVLRFAAREIGGMVDVFELLNEAAGFLPETAAIIRQFWLDGYTAVREEAGEGVKIMIGDAFMTVNSWTNFLTYPSGQGVLMDYHQYQIFSNFELARSFDEHVSFACTSLANLKSFADNNIWTIIGEWSNAATDCAKWLNGRGVGPRWEGKRPQDDIRVFGSCNGFTGNYQSFSTEYKDFLRKYFEVQMEMGETIQGWAFWTWKAENADEWSYEKGLEGGWIPKDPSERRFPDICRT